VLKDAFSLKFVFWGMTFAKVLAQVDKGRSEFSADGLIYAFLRNAISNYEKA
jgi:hypothetical protein